MKNNVLFRKIQTVLIMFLQAVILFATAGTLKWKWAWMFIASQVAILIVNALVLPRELIEERGRIRKDVKKWDRILNRINIIPFSGIFILSGFDYRFHWTGSFGLEIHIAGLILILLGSMIFTWSMISNKFFSTMVSIQDDRGHSTATGGPYRYIRHPGYTGFIIMTIATPVALGSFYALTMAFLVSVIFIVRTIFEDKTLISELPGYLEYSEKVKYKLIPYIW
ncbi:MAG TPA: isoprenylcysteine carboxylmethyltransferase family protein [Bacteroidales bacterium]|nr:isoprenylcysteine carboxylmethyltransferase family protein [Bacteroidales bacterium]HOS71738.1 isoprenylcysteine carboxylmethyltransferase family protein [Bacteroidales bacterium]HQH24933.1 isoprenylcysteine carboxylmethyltransferase family protein [Bacteroidales bacterium]HQJ82337.1 isoprenylcysteine carboxylmethyltransferase family protein [Bacteroidales bacterium]